jgi:hypothetical protein
MEIHFCYSSIFFFFVVSLKIRRETTRNGPTNNQLVFIRFDTCPDSSSQWPTQESFKTHLSLYKKLFDTQKNNTSNKNRENRKNRLASLFLDVLGNNKPREVFFFRKIYIHNKQ